MSLLIRPGLRQPGRASLRGPGLARRRTHVSRAQKTQAPSPFEDLSFYYETKNDAQFIFREVFIDEQYTRVPGSSVRIDLQPGDTVVDVGANIGLFSLYADRKVGPSGRVIACEPVPRVFETLRMNAEASTSRSILPLQLALARTEGATKIRSYAQVSGWNSLKPNEGEVLSDMLAFLENASDSDLAATLPRPIIALFRALPRPIQRQLAKLVVSSWLSSYTDIEIKTRTLSAIIEEQGVERIDLLKIDVERSELDVVEGVAPEHWPRIRKVVAEVHDSLLPQFIQVLKDRGGFCDSEVLQHQDAALKGTGLVLVFAIRR